jgi:hypothetical protein
LSAAAGQGDPDSHMVVTMTNSPFILPLDPAPERPEADFAKEVFVNLAAVALLVSDAYFALCCWAKETERKAREAHLRGERLAAYRARRKWKASDVRPLLSLGANEVAQRRMAALKGKGRPVVRPHRPLDNLLHDKLTNWLKLVRDDATPDERRRSFKVWPWWKHHVEALYRGELERARTNRVKGPHDHAERAVADALWISQGKVHAICGEIRAMRREDSESANFPTMVLAEHKKWMARGELPKRLAAR